MKWSHNADLVFPVAVVDTVEVDDNDDDDTTDVDDLGWTQKVSASDSSGLLFRDNVIKSMTKSIDSEALLRRTQMGRRWKSDVVKMKKHLLYVRFWSALAQNQVH